MRRIPGGRQARAPHPALAALAAVLTAPVVLLCLLLSASGAEAGPPDDGYAPPAVSQVVVPSPTPTPAPTTEEAWPVLSPSPLPPVAQPAPPATSLAVEPPSDEETTILRNALPTLRELLDDPERFAFGAGAAALWFLLVALPGSLLDSAIERRSHGRMGRALASVTSTLNRVVDLVSKEARWKLAGPLLVALVAGTAFGLADPHLSWDARSLSTIASLFVALTMIVVVASQLGAVLARTWWGVDAEVRAEPVGLVAAVAGVAVGRFLSLSPGLFLGLVVGVDAGERADLPRRSRAVVARHTVIFTFAIGAWLVYSLLFGTAAETAAEGGEGLGPVAGFVSDVLTAMTIEGLTYLVTSMLPVSPLPGREVFAHSRTLWGGLYATFAVVFAVLALPSILGEEEHSAGTLARQGAVMVVFTAVAVVGWLRSRGRATLTDELQQV